jgi:hypothetical protein
MILADPSRLLEARREFEHAGEEHHTCSLSTGETYPASSRPARNRQAISAAQIPSVSKSQLPRSSINEFVE